MRISRDAVFRAAAACLLASAAVGSVAGKDLEVKLKAGEFAVLARMGSNPPRLGDNTLEISLQDGAGRPLTSPTILVNYYMPPMPRMVPMNYRKEAKLKKDRYVLKMDFIMAGPWIIAIKITSGDKTVTAKFNIDVN